MALFGSAGVPGAMVARPLVAFQPQTPISDVAPTVSFLLVMPCQAFVQFRTVIRSDRRCASLQMLYCDEIEMLKLYLRFNSADSEFESQMRQALLRCGLEETSRFEYEGIVSENPEDGCVDAGNLASCVARIETKLSGNSDRGEFFIRWSAQAAELENWKSERGNSEQGRS